MTLLRAHWLYFAYAISFISCKLEHFTRILIQGYLCNSLYIGSRVLHSLTTTFLTHCFQGTILLCYITLYLFANLPSRLKLPLCQFTCVLWLKLLFDLVRSFIVCYILSFQIATSWWSYSYIIVIFQLLFTLFMFGLY